jgi:3-oxoacyl-[acyl-carrier-protein] synthase II
MIRGALSDANVTHRDVDYINTHGTGTVLNDAVEASILEREFPHNPLLNCSKSLLGHTIGACGA